MRIDQENYDYLVQRASDNNMTLTDVVSRMISDERNYSDLKKSIRWSNDILEMIYEMTNYLTLEIEYRIGDQFRPRFTSEEKSRIIEQIEARRKQERGYLSGRDRHQE